MPDHIKRQLNMVDEFLFEEEECDKFDKPLYVSQGIPANEFGQEVEERIQEIQSLAKLAVAKAIPHLDQPVKEILKILSRRPYVYAQRPGSYIESAEDCLIRVSGCETTDPSQYKSITWLLYLCFDQDREPEYRVFSVYKEPLKEVVEELMPSDQK